ncbi:MAG: hypothetical protein M1832_004339 [Thelocarpon impressellum]|nr:MAG: hypothetical protein M1832_004339 [Thelocarpon impressellum]
MASSSSTPPSSEPPSSRPSGAIDPVLRNTLRYTVSAKEYELLHRYLLSRAPALRARAPSVARYESVVGAKSDHNAAAVRAAVRVFVGSQAGLKLWQVVSRRFSDGGRTVGPRTSYLKSPSFRLSLSLSSILLLHRLLYRFFSLLRADLLSDDARPFRARNPRVARALVSRLAPAVGASLAGFLLGVCPADQLRVTAAIYVFTRAAEVLYNKLERDGWMAWKPWWVGSWMMMPLASGQLLHAFVFDRDCFPKAYGDFILNQTPNYVQARPADLPAGMPWPGRYDVVDGLAEMARLHYPPFVSPEVVPLPASLSTIAPIVTPAHPAIKHLSCALLHPHDPSCLRTNLLFHTQAFPRLARFFAVVFTLFSLPRYRSFPKAPAAALDALARSVLRTTAFLSGAIGTAWGSICLLQRLLLGRLLPTQRFFLSGFLAGFWGLLERRTGRAQFLYTARASVDSAWKVAVKRGWVRGVRNGDVWLFVVGLAVVNGVFEVDREAVTGSVVRRTLTSMRGGGFVDPAREVGEKKE